MRRRLLDLAVAEAELVELELPVADAVADRLLDGVRLLVDLLEHEGLEAALLGALVVPVDLDDLLLDHLAVGAHERGARGRDGDDVAVVEVLDPARLAHERGHRRGEEHLALADPDHERRLLAHADEQVGMVVVDHDEREVALELAVGLAHRLGEVAVVVALDQVHHRLGVGLGAEGVALRDQLRLELAVVLDDPVEHDRELRVVAAGERVGVPLGDGAVRRPARVAEAVAGVRAVARRGVLQELEVADGADVVEPALLPQREAGRVVTAIFEALEPLHEERPAVTFADVSDDPAHTKTSLENAESPALWRPRVGAVSRALAVPARRW